MNRNYNKGRQKEYRTIYNLKEGGCHIAFRSAGSHSPIDVIGIDLINKTIKFIQCKPKSMSDNTRKKLEEKNKELNGAFLCSFEVI